MIEGNIDLGTFNVDKLIRDSERLKVIRSYVNSDTPYLDRNLIILLCGIEEKSNAD